MGRTHQVAARTASSRTVRPAGASARSLASPSSISPAPTSRLVLAWLLRLLAVLRVAYSEGMADELDYPVLFGTTQATWGPIDLRFELLTGEADCDHIARVYVVPFIGTACVVVGFEHGDWGPAGGGLEPGESIRAALERELAEEAGGGCSPIPRSPCCAATPAPRRRIGLFAVDCGRGVTRRVPAAR
jgi:hypothetical protein